MIEVIEFKTLQKGPTLLFFGAIHGNEKCGPRAIKRVIDEIRSDKLHLLRGNVIFVPVCNPIAYQRHVRYVDENLNRIFRRTKNPQSYESHLANTLCSIIDRCDVFLDIHSITAKGKQFIYLDFPSKRNIAFAKSLGPKDAVVGWPELYNKPEIKHDSFDTTTYARSRSKDCLLIECGQHDNPKSESVAYAAIINTLKQYSFINGRPRLQTISGVKIDRVFFRNKNEQFAKRWKHFDTVEKGKSLIENEKTSITAPYTGSIVMPRWNAKVGEDWLYIGRTIKI